MSAVKAFALSAAVLAAATHPAMAGALNTADLNWISWTPSGVIQTPATSTAATTASLFGLGSTPEASEAPAQPVAPVVTAPAVSAPAAVVAPVSQPPVYDAFINLGSGPYPDANYLTTGGAQPWYNSPQVAALFGGTPNAQQQAQFTQAVLQDVQQTFANSGVPVTLTTNPNASAAHTLSVVSNTVSSWGPVLGLTNIGSNGFDFINQAAQSATNVSQLELIVAHNVSHELMLAFGVPENYDQTGNFIDARNANLSMMLNPNATFSQSAAQALLAQNFLDSNEPIHQGAQVIGAQVLNGQTVPEPSTIAAWTLALGGIVVARSRRARPAA
jgi:hypothetical protein